MNFNHGTTLTPNPRIPTRYSTRDAGKILGFIQPHPSCVLCDVGRLEEIDGALSKIMQKMSNFQADVRIAITTEYCSSLRYSTSIGMSESLEGAQSYSDMRYLPYIVRLMSAKEIACELSPL